MKVFQFLEREDYKVIVAMEGRGTLEEGHENVQQGFKQTAVNAAVLDPSTLQGITTKIFVFLEPKDLAQCRSISKEWYYLGL